MRRRIARLGWLRAAALIAGVVVFSLAGGVSIGIALVRGEERAAVPAPAEVELAPQPYVLPLEYAQLVVFYCDETGVPVWLACRLFAHESGWKAWIVGRENDNGTRDYGLAQLNSAYLENFRVYNDGQAVDPFNPEHAIRIGIRYLAALHEQCGSWREAVRRYAGRRPAADTARIMGEGR
ncbi:MAG: transglycosylase SLT domain-containing protein [Elusimicrobia bacterium]|nr:transglycosylase SLT domain-containing protein [Elusimicrobiota bacterium]